MIGISVFVMLLCNIFLIGILHEHFTQQVMQELRSEARLISEGIRIGGNAYLTEIADGKNRVTLISTDGTVLFDTDGNIAEMENHLNRTEVQEALSSGEGQASRISGTIGKQTLYYALRLEDGRIVRVAAETSAVWTLVLGIVHPLVIVLIITAFIAAFLSQKLADRIIAPVNQLDLNDSELEEPYEELAPFVKKVRSQNADIRRQIQESERRQTEFSIITKHMQEGFLIVDASYEVLSCNPAALHILSSTQEDAIGKNLLSLNRSTQLRAALETALSGVHNEQQMEQDAKQLQIIANPVTAAGKVIGVIVIILDMTEKIRNEQIRREFTANVSHELKTPLTTIYGISDMLCSGMVKEADVKGFSETIRSESQRMIRLIEDILRLSQLDEGNADEATEVISLQTLAEHTAERLRYAAEQADVTLSIGGEDAQIQGIPAVLEEMLYNLTDNAIKYNHAGGTVMIRTGNENGHSFMEVEDTGIGIPEAEQERVFERFYRVDKSHSRKIGGTGLGLSIVKHGAMLHSAKLSLKSKVGEGTAVRVVF